MEQRQFIFVCSVHILIILCVYADPGYDHLNRNVESNVEGIIDVESAEPVDSTQGKTISRMGKPSAGYADYDYYNIRRPIETSSGDNDLSGSSAIRVSSGESIRRPADEMSVKSLPWYGQYSAKSLAMYPSRSYDPYIRRYDR